MIIKQINRVSENHVFENLDWTSILIMKTYIKVDSCHASMHSAGSIILNTGTTYKSDSYGFVINLNPSIEY